MKTLFIPSKYKSAINKLELLRISKKLPKKIAIVYSIQYKNIADEIKNTLSKKHNITKFIQILGCSIPKLSKRTQAILLITDGKFHAVSLGLETKLPIYILDTSSFNQISKNEIEILEKKQKAAYMKYLNSKKIGILISTKPGQENLERAIKFKNKLKEKKSYLFLGDNIDINEFENFLQIQSWVNTACPRLDMNASVVNLNKIS